MAISMRNHLNQLKSMGHLATIEKQVDPVHELPAVAKNIHEEYGKGTLFTDVKGSSIPLTSYIFPNRDSVITALNMRSGEELKEWAVRESATVDYEIVSEAPCQEVFNTGNCVDLLKLPIVTQSDGDAGPYITAGVVIAKDPTTGIDNASFNRLQLVDKDKLRVRMMPPQHLGICHYHAEIKNQPLEAAIVIGAPPALMFSAASKIPLDRSELEFAGALCNKPLSVVKCKTIDIEVPAESEIVIEGMVLANVREDEGPFGEFTDSYVPVMKNHVFHVTAITHRKEPIYHSIYAGGREDLYLLGIPIEAEIYQHVVKFAPNQITGISTAPFVFGCVIGLKKQTEEQAKNVILSALASYSWIKMCIVVDDDVNINDAKDVLWAIQTRCCPDKDIILAKGVSSYTREDVKEVHIGKFGIDATKPLGIKDIMRRRFIPGEREINLRDYLCK